MDDLLDTVAALRAAQDQWEARWGEAFGLDHGLPLDAVFLVSPDVGMRLTRDGRIPDCVRISWLLPPKTAFVITPSEP
jgi:hypothetical protein